MKLKKVQKTRFRRKAKPVVQEEVKGNKEIKGLLLFAMGALLWFSFSYTNSVGPFGNFITSKLYGLLGWNANFIPYLVLFYSIMLLANKNFDFWRSKLKFFMILLVILSAMSHIAYYKPNLFENYTLGYSLKEFWDAGQKLEGGGIVGGILCVPILKIFQTLGTTVILITAAIINLMLLTDISLSAFLKALSDFIKRATVITQKVRERRREKSTSSKAEPDLSVPINGLEIGAILNGGEVQVSEGLGSPIKTQKILYRKDHDLRAGQMLRSRKGEKSSLTEEGIHTEKNGEQGGGSFSEKESRGNVEKEDEPKPKKIFSLIRGLKKNNSKEKLSEVSVAEESKSSVPLQEASKETLPKETPPQRTSEFPAYAKTLYKLPGTQLLSAHESGGANRDKILKSARENQRKLEETLISFGVEAKVVNITVGPAVTRYELTPSPGVKVSKIVSLTDDISLSLASAGIRVEAPIPGKSAIGIEVPNKETASVLLSDVINSVEYADFSSKVAFAVGKDISGENIIADIAKMPHLLIAGATGSGKSVCINSLIVSILYKASPDEVKLLMIDPKVVELGIYNGIPHLLIPVVTDPKKAAGALNWAVVEMTGRYKAFAEKGVRDVFGYNKLMLNSGGEPFPQIVIIIDELADLMMVAPNDVEDSICRLAQMARAAGMHLVVATQRPSVDVITGIIKANIPSRIAFAVSSQVDSRTILDMAGAEKLLGKGDMLFYPVGESKPIRVKGCFISEKEVERIVSFVKTQKEPQYSENILQQITNASSGKEDSQESDEDDLLDSAIEIVVESGQASASLLQRKLKVGYARAARMIDQMEAKGVIGNFEGSKPRQVLLSKNQFMEQRFKQKE